MQSWPECTYQYTYNNRTSGKTQLHRHRHSRYGKWYATYNQADAHSHKHAYQIRFVEGLCGVAEQFFHILYGVLLTHHHQAVAQLQSQVWSSQKFHTATIDACGVDAIFVSEFQRSEFLAIPFGLGDYYLLRYQVAVDGVPVDIFIVPIHFHHAFAKKQREVLGILFACHHQQMIVFSKHRVRIGTFGIAIAPQARHHKCLSAYSTHFLQGLAEYSGIENAKLCHIGFVVVLMGCVGNAIFAETHHTHQRQRHYHAHHTQRICHSTSQCQRTARQSHLLSRLLSRCQRRCVGGCSTQHAHQVGKIHPRGKTYYYCHQQS